MPKMVDDTEMVRITIRLPKSTLEELERLAFESGMYSQHFYQAAIIGGARLLSQYFTNMITVMPTGYEDASPAEVTHEESLREKAERLRRKSTTPRKPSRSRADDYLEGLLDNP